MADELKPPDAPEVIAARYARAAQDAVTAAAQAGFDAFDKVNGDPMAEPAIPPTGYQPADAINSLTKLAGAALSGGIALARVALQTQWDRRVLLVADNVVSIVNTGLTDVLAVAGGVAKKSSAMSIDKQQQAWLDAAIQLTHIGALRGAEILETVVAGPGAYANPVITRTITIGDADRRDKKANIALQKLIRVQGNPDIAALVRFEPPTPELAANATEFTLVINTAGIPSGVYLGELWATDSEVDPADPGSPVVRKISFPVAIPEITDPPEP